MLGRHERTTKRRKRGGGSKKEVCTNLEKSLLVKLKRVDKWKEFGHLFFWDGQSPFSFFFFFFFLYFLLSGMEILLPTGGSFGEFLC